MVRRTRSGKSFERACNYMLCCTPFEVRHRWRRYAYAVLLVTGFVIYSPQLHPRKAAVVTTGWTIRHHQKKPRVALHWEAEQTEWANGSLEKPHEKSLSIDVMDGSMHAKTQHVASLLLLARAMSIAPAVVVQWQLSTMHSILEKVPTYTMRHNFPPPFNSPAANTTAVLNSKSHVAPRR
jgi:hypothetical protein